MAKHSANSIPPKVNIIDTGATFEGTLSANSDIRISGTVNGLIQGLAAVVVSHGGTVVGDVHAKRATIAGKIKGSIIVKEQLLLKGTALIEGTITAARLVVEDGALFNGDCNMQRNAKTKKDVVITTALNKRGLVPAKSAAQ